ncbi:nucleoside triphosphate pyrophosphohydrolase family protein [Mammaliicoccus sciuri]|uniref:nucleoside triphosphate pyrophosphohydrolase family protein n=1 Tax=Mammaliicoccus sciuri TaxID=1296 RepID=UPI001E489742|nr:nucleoside triphosphate pyrophosphohydrolase family protein [Mammaliicoccus sciuri]MCD8797399.1 nucleoside triphosphate pyrophosphohydrolase family protein [Mammaliicoccus sciuri]UXU84628.1 nucleoside triphosphate pyrophosphohydrolase family protein [Mammaliicoccus sciuri]UXU94476.1 nucleoside triphosphate pyrophosphohydrolase family protein [Mammaliicoccus sciuri]UXV16424.1 nucleoside triphosphate pyrophosphohydrolase family protein [Mammaliicoccus sciuri]UXV24686.1 nucleoside triphosphate
MELNKYQEIALRTHNVEQNMSEALTNYALGLTGESGEVADNIKKHIFHGHELNKDEMVKELGDVLWYLSSLASMCDVTLDEVAGHNLNKLSNRYPGGFSQQHSINRVENISPGDKILFSNSQYIVDDVIGNTLLISNDNDDQQVNVYDVKKL